MTALRIRCMLQFFYLVTILSKSSSAVAWMQTAETNSLTGRRLWLQQYRVKYAQQGFCLSTRQMAYCVIQQDKQPIKLRNNVKMMNLPISSNVKQIKIYQIQELVNRGRTREWESPRVRVFLWFTTICKGRIRRISLLRSREAMKILLGGFWKKIQVKKTSLTYGSWQEVNFRAQLIIGEKTNSPFWVF